MTARGRRAGGAQVPSGSGRGRSRRRPARAACAFAFLCAVLSGAQPAVAETNSLLVSWLNVQTKVHSWSADLIQTRRLKSLTQPLTATGHVWFEAPNRFHWEIGRPAQTIAVREPDQMLVIYPRLKRAERFPLTGGQTGPWRDVLALLEAGFPRSQADLERQYELVSQTVTNQLCEITLQPKSADARRMIPQLKIDFATNDYSLRATELEFADGSTLRNDFTNIVLNPEVDRALFAPKLEGDYKVVEPFKR
jgi:outer membrane lipoprotein-sorting protein